jgi:predicted MFS family arabinose efflux permease
MLALVMLINRSGTMVLPFLSIYLTGSLGFSLQQAGIVLSMFGLGSMAGAWLGGWLTDRIGHFRVQLGSLTGGGILFILLSAVDRFLSLAVGIFLVSLVAEALRPANASSIASYARPENIARAFSLNRLAINLGFSIGPALGGLLAVVSYRLLFWADGLTCLGAALFFYFYFRNRRGQEPKPGIKIPGTGVPRSPYRDAPFLLFVLFTCLFAVVFFQLFTTLPLYYREVYQLSERQIGGLLALNGLVVFSLEMIVVYMLGRSQPMRLLISSGIALTGFSFLILVFKELPAILVLSMIGMSLGEILAMPFMATYTVQRSGEGNMGAYMGLYTIAYSAAHVLAPSLGTTILHNAGFDALWWASGILSLVAATGMYLLLKKHAS